MLAQYSAVENHSVDIQEAIWDHLAASYVLKAIPLCIQAEVGLV